MKDAISLGNVSHLGGKFGDMGSQANIGFVTQLDHFAAV